MEKKEEEEAVELRETEEKKVEEKEEEEAKTNAGHQEGRGATMGGMAPGQLAVPQAL